MASSFGTVMVSSFPLHDPSGAAIWPNLGYRLQSRLPGAASRWQPEHRFLPTTVMRTRLARCKLRSGFSSEPFYPTRPGPAGWEVLTPGEHHDRRFYSTLLFVAPRLAASHAAHGRELSNGVHRGDHRCR
jgi:hypothetical protein